MSRPLPPGPVRTLHRLVLPARLSHPAPGERLRRGLCIATAALPEPAHRGEPGIALALLPFTYTTAGRIVDVRHEAARVHRVRAPGETSTLRSASARIAAADFVVAHDAASVRPAVERLAPVAHAVAWACIQREVPWAEAGFASTALPCLGCGFGVQAPDPHGALGRCELGVWLLASALPPDGLPVFAALRARALEPTVRLWAVGAPAEAYAALAARGYRWMAGAHQDIAPSWWTELAPHRLDEERGWLAEHAYRAFGAVVPEAFPERGVTAVDRWRDEPPEGSAIGEGGAPFRRVLH